MAIIQTGTGALGKDQKSMKTSVIILSIFIAIAGFFVWQRFFRNDFNLPRGGNATKETIAIKDGEVINSDKILNAQLPVLTKEIMVTDGVKHSVPLNEILGGGPPKDGIPSIDNPKFVSVSEASKLLRDNEPGIAISIDGATRFYPFQILVWHEIVNDTINGRRVLVTYCPLCLSGIIFDPIVNGERVEFGTSGKLWNSNLVMYDRKTESLWSQILGEAIVGEMTGTQLKVLPSDMIRYGDFKKQNPDGTVLSRDTGTTRFYGQDPYGDYYTTPGTYFPVGKKDDRLNDKDFILGIVVNGKAKAYWPEAVKKAGEVEDNFEGKTIIARYEKEIDAVRLFFAQGGSASGGEKKLERINPFGAFWFSWVAAHPDTELFK